ncbi:MAG: TonB-dependent receptor [Gammaproteobacteria bacterium]|nr:TonB-dependent receptor [Gammaproteobacteria bacterium]
MKNRLLSISIIGSLLMMPVHADEQVDGFLDLDLDDLLSMEVTSVSKKKQRLNEAAAAVFVVSQKDIRRSGVTSIPEALRMVPGLQVARIDSNKWAISSRGFNGRFANKLLVLMDGRSVYSPSFSGVYWEAQDYLMEDVERIEVIRGPGATLWGANAVNGVINIITKNAEETEGGLVTASLGNEDEASFGLRYGTDLGKHSKARVYAKAFARDEFVNPLGSDAGDDWDKTQAGFRIDSHLGADDNITVQGDFYRGDIHQTMMLASLAAPFFQVVQDTTDISGGNLLGSWQHRLSSSSGFTLKAYWDWNDRDEAMVDQSGETLDIDFQHQLSLGNHDLIWGAGYRHITTEMEGVIISNANNKKRDDDLFSFFVQDEITLIEDRLKLTIGSKFEHNEYSGEEVQPSLRMVWTPNANQSVWASVSRAVRTPSRAEHDMDVLTVVIPPFTLANPGPFPVAVTPTHNSNYESEELTAWEWGYRITPAKSLSFDLALFYNDYDSLRNNVFDPPVFMGTHLLQPIVFQNDIEGQTHGAELAVMWQPSESWQWNLAYSYFESDFDYSSPSDLFSTPLGPRHQLSLRSIIYLSENLDLDFWVRYVDKTHAVDGINLTLLEIDSFTTFDVRLAWRPHKQVELSLVGQNLFDSQHLESIQESFTLQTEVERSLYGKVTWSF